MNGTVALGSVPGLADLREAAHDPKDTTATPNPATDGLSPGEALERERQLMRRLLSVHERGQRCVADAIHEEFGQKAIAALMYLQAFRSSHAGSRSDEAALLVEAESLLARCVDRTRRWIGRLAPPTLDGLGLIGAIEAMVRRAGARQGTEIRFEHAGEFSDLPTIVATSIVRIVEELFDNARLHSESDRIRIALCRGLDTVCAAVQDWGVGFDRFDRPRERFGLHEVRHRAWLLGGSFDVWSAPGLGTLATVEVPCAVDPTRARGAALAPSQT